MMQQGGQMIILRMQAFVLWRITTSLRCFDTLHNVSRLSTGSCTVCNTRNQLRSTHVAAWALMLGVLVRLQVEVLTPEDHMGDVIGDLNSRRGLINKFEDKPGGMKVVQVSTKPPGVPASALPYAVPSAALNVHVQLRSFDTFIQWQRVVMHEFSLDTKWVMHLQLLSNNHHICAVYAKTWLLTRFQLSCHKLVAYKPTLLCTQGYVPLAEMFSYVSTLRGMTKGRAQYSMQLERYEVVPPNIQTEIVSKAKVA